MPLYIQREVEFIVKSCTDPQEHKVYNRADYSHQYFTPPITRGLGTNINFEFGSKVLKCNLIHNFEHFIGKNCEQEINLKISSID